MVGAFGVAAGQLSAGWPDSFLRWALLIVGSAAGGLVARTDTVDFLWDSANMGLRKLRPVPLRKALLALVVLLLALLTGRTVAFLGPSLVNGARVALFGCPPPAQLTLLSTSQGSQSALELAHAYERYTAQRDFGCPEADIHVYEASPADARQALTAGWTDDQVGILGPRPDLWLPGSSIFEVKAEGPQGRLSKVDVISVASTPVVLAIPEELEDVRLNYVGDTWSQALAEMAGRKWGVARTDPTKSLAGKLATVAIYRSLAGGKGKTLSVAQARLFERGLEQTLDRGGYPLGDELDLLCRHLRPDPPKAAIIVTEQQMVRFNTELPLGGPCATLASPTHSNRMKGIYPSDTLGFDYPVIRLEWKDSSPGQLRQARAFSDWLTAAGGRAALLETGLRPHGHPVPWPRVPFPSEPPDDIEPTMDTYALAKRPGRVLLALDTSGSMREAAPDGRRRFDVAVQGVSGAMRMLGDRDELGLWVFPGTGGKRELVPLGPGRQQRQLVDAALPGIEPTGPTPLYRTIVDGVGALSATDGESAKAVVVLTDGEDYGSGLSSAQVVDAISGKGVRVFIVAVGEASCASQELMEITQKSAGSCRQATFGDLEATLSEVFTLLWKGA